MASLSKKNANVTKMIIHGINNEELEIRYGFNRR